MFLSLSLPLSLKAMKQKCPQVSIKKPIYSGCWWRTDQWEAAVPPEGFHQRLGQGWGRLQGRMWLGSGHCLFPDGPAIGSQTVPRAKSPTDPPLGKGRRAPGLLSSAPAEIHEVARERGSG